MNSAKQQAGDNTTSGPFIRPPLLFVGSLILGLVLDHILPLPFVRPNISPVNWAVGGGLIVLGVAIFAMAVRNFSRAATPVPSTQPVRVLVTTGIHGLSRNPIYVGMFLIYIGAGIAAWSAWVLLLVLPIAIVMRYGVVAREEVYLEQRFGEVYRDYKARVRRWL